MAFRRPLYQTSAGNFQEWDDATLDFFTYNIIGMSILGNLDQHDSYITQVSSGGNVTLNDTRLIAGAGRTSTTGYVGSASTADVSVKTISYDRLSINTSANFATSYAFSVTNTSRLCYGVSSNSGNDYSIYPFSDQDYIDTFGKRLSSFRKSLNDEYVFHTTNSKTGYTLVSNTPCFSNTEANITNFASGALYEAVDQASTINNYYLFRKTATIGTATDPINNTVHMDNTVSTGDAPAAIYVKPVINSDIINVCKYTAKYVASYRVRFRVDTSAVSGVSVMSTAVDTRYNSSTYRQYFQNADDYRSQEVPSGTRITQNTYNLGIELY